MRIPNGCVPVLAVSFLAIFSLGSTRGDQSCGALVTATDGEDLNGLMSRAFSSFRRACRKQENIQEGERQSCSFVTQPTTFYNVFTFILKPLVPPFQLNFDVKAPSRIAVLLAAKRTSDSVFAEINIGEGIHNEEAFIRTCYSGDFSCDRDDQPASTSENGLLVSSVEFRTFWVEFKEGAIAVGKGGESKGFLNWIAAVNNREYPEVHVGIGTYGSMERGDWVFHAFCESFGSDEARGKGDSGKRKKDSRC